MITLMSLCGIKIIACGVNKLTEEIIENNNKI